MNKQLRYYVIALLLLPSCRSLFASQALMVTGKSLAAGISKASLIPLYLMQFPFAVAAELLFNKKIGRSTPSEMLKSEDIQDSIPGAPKIHTTIQTASPLVSIPQVVGEVMSGLPKGANPPLFINVNVHSQQTAVSSHADTTTPAPQKISDASKNAPSRKQILSILPSREWVREHRVICAVSCGALIYGGLQCYLWYIARKLSRIGNWSPWKSFCSLHDLYQMKQTELLKSLMSSFEDAYQEINPMINAQRFIKEVSSELSYLKRYTAILNFFERWYVKRFFFVDRSLLTSIPERIQRLEFLKNSLTGWLKEYRQTYSYDGLFKQNIQQ